MKVCIVVFSNIKYSPYLNYYEMYLDNRNIDYDVIFFRRDKEIENEMPQRYISIDWIGKKGNESNKITKLLNFIRFCSKTKRILSKGSYSHVFVLTTLPGVLLEDFLVKNYRSKYLVDIRDYTFEKNRFYFKRLSKLVNNSMINLISSNGFKNFLPNSNYRLIHNYSLPSSDQQVEKCFNSHLPIKIAYIGSIAYVEQCKKIVDLVNKDNRFSMLFFGNETVKGSISNYVKAMNNERILFCGPFAPDEKFAIYNQIDLVFNCYGNNTPLVKYAISNKYYDGALHKKPLIVSPNTEMQIASQGFAFALDLLNVNDLDALFDWYKNLNFDSFDLYTDEVIEKAKKDNSIIEYELDKLLYENKKK